MYTLPLPTFPSIMPAANRETKERREREVYIRVSECGSGMLKEGKRDSRGGQRDRKTGRQRQRDGVGAGGQRQPETERVRVRY